MSPSPPLQDMAESVFEAMNTRDFSEFQTYLADEVIFDFPGVAKVQGQKKVVVFLKALVRNYKELTFAVTDTITENNKVCVVWENKGEHNDGTVYENRGITLFYFDKEQIVFISDYFKDTSFVERSRS